MAVLLSEVLDSFSFVKSDLSKLPCKLFGPGLAQSYNGHKTSPDSLMERYYLGQHYLGVIKDNHHEHELISANTHQAIQEILAIEDLQYRILHYLMLITVREARHMKVSSLTEIKDNVWKASDEYVREVEGSPHFHAIRVFIDSNKGDSHHSVMNRQVSDMIHGNLAEVPIGEVYAWVCMIFEIGHFSSSSFGGKPWHNVTRALFKYLKGEYSLSLLSDVAWALCHNNGPIFNKEVVFGGYSDHLVTKLDVQRAGMMPELVQESKTITSGDVYYTVTQDARDTLGILQNYYPIPIQGTVDWDLVAKTSEENVDHLKELHGIEYGTKATPTFHYGVGYLEVTERG